MTPLFSRKDPDLLKQELSPETTALFDAAVKDYTARQDAWDTAIDLDGVGEYSFDHETGILTIVHDTGVEGAFNAEILATYQMDGSTWEWSWNDPHVAATLSKIASSLKKVGKAHKVKFLTKGRFTLTEPEHAHQLVSLGIGLSDAIAVFQASYNDLVIFLAVKAEVPKKTPASFTL